MRLFLFDIDGTLLSARGAGRLALAQAMSSVYGTSGAIDEYDFRGKTDPRIVLDLMQAAGFREDEVKARLAACFEAYVGALATLIGDGARVVLMPGVADVVRALAARSDALVGLLTGNIEPGARVKLLPTGLWSVFRVGAFGSDDADRRRLPTVAVSRARSVVGRDFAFEQVTIIGDTPLDVDCARACGAVAVAVATGQHAAAELAACNPDALFGNFSNVQATVSALMRGRP